MSLREAEPATRDAGGREPTGRGTVVRRLAALSLLVLVAAGAGVAWWNSRLGTYSVMAMGHQHGPSPVVATTSVTQLVADPARPADVRVTLEARQERFVVPGGQAVDGYTIGGSSPGPVIRARQGQLVEVTLVNESVADGVALHWHGVDVPNAEDGVAGITQDAVPVGGRHVYRFVAERRRDVLVPLAPDVARAGRARTPRTARRRPGRRTASGCRPVGPAPPVCGSAHFERPSRGRARRRSRGVDRPRPGGQHRPGHRRRLVLRSVPGGGDRRPRRHGTDRGDRPIGPRRRRWPGRRRGPDAGRRVRDEAAARGPQHGHRAGGDVGARRAAAEGRGGPDGLRVAGTHGHRHGASRPGLRVRDRAAVRAAGRAPGQLVDDQRPALPRRPDVPRPPRRRRDVPDREPVGRGAPDAPARPPRRSS